MSELHVLVSGGSSQIGKLLLPRLVKTGYRVVALTRNVEKIEIEGVRSVEADLLEGLPELERLQVYIHIAPLWTLPSIIADLADTGIDRIVAFGSTSRFTKIESTDPKELAVAKSLARAEKSFMEQCEERSISWTLLRPTMIYGMGVDQNVTAIARVIEKFRFFPVAGSATGLRQPVHAEDLAIACLATVSNEKTFNKAYDLSGGESVTYREMVSRVFTAMGLAERIISIPVPLLRLAVRMLSLLPGYGHVSVGMAEKMATDLCFDHSEATRDFAYTPRGFSPTFGE